MVTSRPSKQYGSAAATSRTVSGEPLGQGPSTIVVGVGRGVSTGDAVGAEVTEAGDGVGATVGAPCVGVAPGPVAAHPAASNPTITKRASRIERLLSGAGV